MVPSLVSMPSVSNKILGTYPRKIKGEGELMAVKSETPIQRRIKRLIEARGGYIPKKNHGNMITVPGLHDLPFTYHGYSCFFEVKTPNTPDNASDAQGIHCRLARKALALTAIVYTIDQTTAILDQLDLCHRLQCTPTEMLVSMTHFFEQRGLDDGTKY